MMNKGQLYKCLCEVRMLIENINKYVEVNEM